MNVIEMKTRGENDHVPEDFKGQFDLYRVMKSLDVRNKKFLSYFQDDFFKIANSRNPFTRLYSAWNDKSRTHRRQDGSGMVSPGSGVFASVEIFEKKIWFGYGWP